MTKAGIISLGCPRNLVDSEVILGSLKECGFEIAQIEDGVDICVINTCSFVSSAKDESIDAIMQACQLKKEGRIKNLIVCGCLPQLYKDALIKKIPEIDLVLGTNDFHKIKEFAGGSGLEAKRALVSDDLGYIYDETSPRFSLTPRHYAYVKISEGCSNLCSYCIISDLRGKFRSRPIESIIAQIKNLARGGALKEVNLIGQDTTLFGIDRYGQSRFPELLRKICRLRTNVRWVRILYTHPAHYTEELISTIRDEEKICGYLDLPIQHISDKILKMMNRHTTKKDIMKLIQTLRKKIKGLVLRSSIIVGFPGETEEDFKELLNFIRETRFERLGAFIYSKEEGTEAAAFECQVPDKVKEERFDELMKAQQAISRDVNKAYLGKKVEVLIDEKVEGEAGRFLGRTQGDAPEVDGTVYVNGRGIKPGEFYSVKINDTLEYDLVGGVA